MQFPRCALLLVALAVLATLPVRACYSGLVIIPTTDTVGAGQYGVEFQTDGDFPTPEPDTYILNTQFGVTDRFEAGVDFDFSDGGNPELLFNAKYVFLKSKNVSAAVGVCNAGEHSSANPYAVLTRDYGFGRLHAGALRSDDKTFWFAGADTPITDKLTLMADYTSGDENYSSAGLGYQFNDHCGLLAGAQFPNAGGDTLYTVHLCFTGAFTGK